MGSFGSGHKSSNFFGGWNNMLDGYHSYVGSHPNALINRFDNNHLAYGATRTENSGLDPLGFLKMIHANNLKDQQAGQQARYDAQTQANLARQRGMSSGLTGGASAGGEIKAYNNVLADSAAQRSQLAQADQQQSMQNIGMLLSVLGMMG